MRARPTPDHPTGIRPAAVARKSKKQQLV